MGILPRSSRGILPRVMPSYLTPHAGRLAGRSRYRYFSYSIRNCQRKKSPRNSRGDFEVFGHAPRNGGPSVNVVLLPVEGGVGLNDDVFVSGLLEFVH